MNGWIDCGGRERRASYNNDTTETKTTRGERRRDKDDSTRKTDDHDLLDGWQRTSETWISRFDVVVVP
jgi:hypothetical protein